MCSRSTASPASRRRTSSTATAGSSASGSQGEISADKLTAGIQRALAVVRRSLVAACSPSVLAAPALASERHPTLGELEGEVMCPTCKTTLDQSSAPIADRIRQFISARIAAGDTKSEIKREARRAVRAGDPGRAVEARVQPARVGAAVRRARARGGGARLAGLALVAPRDAGRRRSGRAARPGARPPGGRRACSLRRLASIPVAFAVGFVSIVLPCVLPLVPGYLSAVSAVEARPLRRAGRGAAGRAREPAVHRSGSPSSSSCSAPARRRSAASSNARDEDRVRRASSWS